MCGLFGEFGQDVLRDEAALAAISRSIRHRGPDDDGLATGNGWMLGFRRLAILDLSPAGHQPLFHDDGRYVLVYNGEIYNYLELKAELLAAGEHFRSGTDTEVLLKLLIREGAAALPRLNGMFAFAFVDMERRRFVVARDRLGVKPLYLHHRPGQLRFASELKALLEWPGAERRIDRGALADYLAMGYLPHESCIFQGYSKLAPGHFLSGSIDGPEVVPQRWWQVTMQPEDRGSDRDDALLEELDALLDDALRIRMRSDVPVALLLSGGIDSGLVAAYAARTGQPPLALVAGVGSPEMDETDLARATATHLGIDLREMQLTADSLKDVDRVATSFDEPFADTSALPTLRICEAARQHATVLLTGDGGDEAFGGYRRYLEAQRYKHLMNLPEGVQRLAWAAGRGWLPPRLAYRLAKATLPDELLGAVFDGFGLTRDPALALILPDGLTTAADVAAPVARAWAKSAGLDLLSRQRDFDYRCYLTDDVLVKVDRASMAHSTEVRSPFLDYRVVEWAARLPHRLLMDDRHGKLMLRRLAAGMLPPAVTTGRKKGFGAPVDDWFRTPGGAAMIRDRLVANGVPDLWNPAGVAQVLALHLARKRNYGDILWRLLVLEAWHRRYLAPELSDKGLAA